MVLNASNHLEQPGIEGVKPNMLAAQCCQQYLAGNVRVVFCPILLHAYRYLFIRHLVLFAYLHL